MMSGPDGKFALILLLQMIVVAISVGGADYVIRKSFRKCTKGWDEVRKKKAKRKLTAYGVIVFVAFFYAYFRISFAG